MKQKVSLMLLILLSIPSITHAYSDYIIASGENIGITVKTNGVLVVGTSKIEGADGGVYKPYENKGRLLYAVCERSKQAVPRI